MRIKCMSRSVLVSIAFCSMSLNALPAESAETHCGVYVQAKVKAPLKITYDTLRNLRSEEPDGSKIISSSETECVVEEIFDKLPVIGQAVCVYKETYEGPNRVAFKMIRSDKLKAFEGEWTLTEADGGKSTIVKLHSFVDVGLKIPFAKQMTQMASTGEVKHHVDNLKHRAEKHVEKQLASEGARRPL